MDLVLIEDVRADMWAIFGGDVMAEPLLKVWVLMRKDFVCKP
jgi:hypothetical protein